jgi:hypothetical protein
VKANNPALSPQIETIYFTFLRARIPIAIREPRAADRSIITVRIPCHIDHAKRPAQYPAAIIAISFIENWVGTAGVRNALVGTSVVEMREGRVARPPGFYVRFCPVCTFFR